MRSERNPLRKHVPSGVWNIAHRGARAFAPENTLPAFEKAKTFGCSMFELDVHRCKDGALVVHHDDTMTRCTDVARKFPRRRNHFLADFTLADLRELDAGSWFVREIELPAAERQPFLQSLTPAEMRRFIKPADRTLYQSGAVRVPTLQEALEVARHAEMMVNVEVKTSLRMDAGLAKAVVELVKNMGMEHRVLISSFDHQQLQTVRRLSDAVAIGVLTTNRLARPADYLRLLDADAYHPVCGEDHDAADVDSVAGVIDRIGIRNVRGARLGVNTWTCNDRRQMRALIAEGVTGIITDFPNRLRDVLAE